MNKLTSIDLKGKKKLDTTLFYCNERKVSINDIETLKQWLKENIPFHVSVKQDKSKRESNPNPITIFTDKDNDLDQFLPIIKENFGNYSSVKKDAHNTFTFEITQIGCIGRVKARQLLDKYVTDRRRRRGTPCYLRFKTLKDYYKIAGRVDDMKLNGPDWEHIEIAHDKVCGLQSNIEHRMLKGFRVSEKEFENFLECLEESFALFCEIVS